MNFRGITRLFLRYQTPTTPEESKDTVHCHTQNEQYLFLRRPIGEGEIIFKGSTRKDLERLAGKLKKKILNGELSFSKINQLFPIYEIRLNNCVIQVSRSAGALSINYYLELQGPNQEDKAKIGEWDLPAAISSRRDPTLSIANLFYAFREGKEQEEQAAEEAAHHEHLVTIREAMDKCIEFMLSKAKNEEERERIKAKRTPLPDPSIMIATRRKNVGML